MLVALRIVFGDALRRDLRWLAMYRTWRAGMIAGLAVLMLGITVVGVRASGVWRAGRTRAAADWQVRRVDRVAAMILDARGRIAWRLDGSSRGTAALVARL